MNPSDFILPDIPTQYNYHQGVKRDRSSSSFDRITEDPNAEKDAMWIDKYEPQTESQIGVTPQLMTKMKRSFEYSALRNGITKIMILTGPTGSGKSTVINVLCKIYGYELVEWFTPSRDWSSKIGYMEVFKKFMQESTNLNTLDSIDKPNNGKVILLDDLPDLTTDEVKMEFFSILKSCLDVSQKFLVVIIATDSYISQEGNIYLNFKEELSFDRRVDYVEFKPIPNTHLKRVLQNIANRENLHVPNSLLENIIDNSNGDIRIAINSLQFQSVAGTPSSQPLPKKRKNRKGEVIVDFNRHVGHLSLFHAVGKVLYAKRNVNGTFESSPEHIVNKIPKGNDGFIDYLHQNCIDFFKNIEDCAHALDEISDADTIRSTMDWQDSVASLYRNFVTINGIMKNRKEQKVGTFKELAGPLFNNLRYDQLKRQREAYHQLWMASVQSRNTLYIEENPEIDMSVYDPIEAFSSDEDGFDDIFGDGSELADLDF